MTTISIQSNLGTLTASNSPGFVDINGVQWSLVTHTGLWDAPPVRTNYVARPLAWGEYDGPVYPDKRVIVVKMSTVTTSEAQRVTAARQARAVLADGSLGTLTITDDIGTLWTPVRRSDVTSVAMVGQSGFDVSFQFTAADPRLFGDTKTQTTQMAQSSGIGVPWRGATGSSGVQWKPGILWRGASGGNPNSGVLTVDNSAGTAPADVVFTITGPALNPTLRTATSFIRYGGALGIGDVLVINTGTGSVLLNGVNRRALLTSAQWFQAPAGQSLAVAFNCEVQNSQATCTAACNVSYL